MRSGSCARRDEAEQSHRCCWHRYWRNSDCFAMTGSLSIAIPASYARARAPSRRTTGQKPGGTGGTTTTNGTDGGPDTGFVYSGHSFSCETAASRRRQWLRPPVLQWLQRCRGRCEHGEPSLSRVLRRHRRPGHPALSDVPSPCAMLQGRQGQHLLLDVFDVGLPSIRHPCVMVRSSAAAIARSGSEWSWARSACALAENPRGS
jgi:hypothetical protein